MTHTITREMLVATLNDVMTERDAAERLRDQYRDDYSKTLTSNTKLRAQVETLESNAKLALEQLDAERAARRAEYERAEQFKKNLCTCSVGPIQTRAPDENTRIRELVAMVNSKDDKLLQLSMQCDALKREIALLTVKITPPFQLEANIECAPSLNDAARVIQLVSEVHAIRDQRDRLSKAFDAAGIQLKHERDTRGEVTKARDDLAGTCMLLEQQLKIRTTERDSLHKQQCQCVPVLENQLQTALAARDQALSQLPETMQHCTIKYLECEFGHGRLHATNWIDHGCHHCKLEKLRELFNEGMHSTEVLMANPPKNMVAYRGDQILRGLP